MTPIQQNINTPVKTNKKSRLTMPIFLRIVCWFISVSAKADTLKSISTPINSSQLAQLKVTPKPCVAPARPALCPAVPANA